MSNLTFSGFTGTPWDGIPLPDGAHIALQSTGYATLDCGDKNPLSSFIGTTALAGSVFTHDQSMTATMDYLVAPLPASDVGSVFRVTTWPHVAREEYPWSTNFQKLILQGPSGQYVEIADVGSSGNNYSVSALQADARVFLLAPVEGKQVLFDPGYTYGQRAEFETDLNGNTSRDGVYQLMICKMPFFQSPLSQVIQGLSTSSYLNVFVMTPR